MTVVVGNVIVVEAKELPHVIVRAVPSSRIRISSKSPSTGVPVRLEVMEEISVAKAEMINRSVASEFMAGVADDTMDTTRRVILADTLLAVMVPVKPPSPVTKRFPVMACPAKEVDKHARSRNMDNETKRKRFTY